MARVRKVRVDNLTPTRLVELAQSGRIRIPTFQRGYRWRVSDVADLFDSIVKRYPIGNLLFWERPTPADRVSIGPWDVEVPASNRALWVVDGQQRIISIVATLMASRDQPDPRFAVCAHLETGEYRSFPGREPPAPWLPLRVAGSNRDLLDWQRTNAGWLRPVHYAAAEDIVSALREYPIPAYIVEADDERELRIIFGRMNTAGRPLGITEVFNALHGVQRSAAPGDLKDIVDRIDSTGFGRVRQEEVLRTLLALRGSDVFRDIGAEFADNSEREAAFRSTERVLLTVVATLREDVGIPHVRVLPYAAVIPMVASMADRFGRPAGRSAELLRRWIWRGAALGANIGGDVPGVRRSLRAISRSDSAVDAAQALLRSLPRVDQRWVPNLSQVRNNTAGAKVNMLALWAEGPMRLGAPATEQPLPTWQLTATELFEDTERPLLEILPPRPVRDSRAPTMANRLLHPPIADPIEVLHKADRQVLQSHCMDGETVRLLAVGDYAGFLEHRTALMNEVISRQVDAHAEWGASDRRPLADLLGGADRGA